MKTVTREGEYPLGGGGFADIWKGQCDNQVVCLKVLRFYVEANQKKKESAVSAFCQEAMIFEIASGLAYLHSLRPVVIHGDIKGINILVDEYHNCRLADFGLAAVLETQVVKNVTSGAVRGSVHWMAPELFMSSSSVSDKRPADIYAYGCTVFEVGHILRTPYLNPSPSLTQTQIMTGHPPFSNFNDYQVILEVLKGTRPPKPTFSWFLGNVWDLVESCWHSDSGKRPCAVEIEQGLERLLSLRDEESKCVGDVPS
ncbi:hypothetical protein VNI00_019471 [Paramarasmius palmivorus]|uniref:Protein kinase domain-containing protein n=1 Tax=Paramarasmius palmivorus TaxID=297713 RepID=A0AAW0AKC8_9AGAR